MIGRQLEFDALVRLLTDPGVRLVTLIGPGGVGKTLLATHVARDVAERRPCRVVVVELAGVESNGQVLPAVADALGVGAGPGNVLADAVAAAITIEPTLLVLDNAEHLADAGAAVAALLADSSGLTILVTSRVALGVDGESVMPVGPLSITENGSGSAADLFVQRVGPTVPPPDLATIVELCDELGGLPLAIELAASCCVVMTPTELLHAIRTHGAVDALDRRPNTTPARHRDLRSTVAWSVALLDATERRLLDAAATFVGWATGDEIAAVAGGAAPLTAASKLNALTSVVAHHLLEVSWRADSMVFRLHPVVRAVIIEAPDTTVAALTPDHDRQAVAFARRAAMTFDSPDAPTWLDALDRRHDDLRATLQRALQRGDGPTGAAVVLGLAQLWHQRGGADQLLRLVDELLAQPSGDGLSADDRSGLLSWRAYVGAEWRTPDTDVDAIANDLKRAMELAVASGDDQVIMRAAVLSLRSSLITRHHEQAEQHAAIGLRAASSAGAEHVVARLQVASAMLVAQTGRFEEAVRLTVSALLAARRLGADSVAATATLLLVQSPLPYGLIDPKPEIDDVVRLAGAAGDRRTLAIAYIVIASRKLAAGDVAAASGACGDAIRQAVAIGHANLARLSILKLVAAAVASDRLSAAATLHGGVADHLDGLLGILDVEEHRTNVKLIADGLGEPAFQAATDQGRALQWADLVGYALACVDAWSDSERAASVVPRRPLTSRELDVLRLVAAGKSNKQIAAELGISPKTSMHHTANIYAKIGVQGRAAATAWAYRVGIVDD